MTDAQMVANLLAWSGQAACVIGLAGALSWLVRIDAPAVRFAWWRAVLVLCLALPWVQGRSPVPPDEPHAAAAGGVVITETLSFATVPPAGPAAAGWTWPAALLVLMLAGAAVRVLWLGVMVVRLERLRRAGVPAPGDAAHDDLQREVGTQAIIRYVSALEQPVTFGVRRPVVLLPASLRAQPADIQRAVVCHELMHVRRRDWLWLVGEEIVRAALWFHPGIWWLVSRIQLAREEVVDALTVKATRRRRAYIEALVAFADGTPQAVAAAFSRRNHLFRRIVLVSKEAVMSTRRVVGACSVMVLVLAGGGWYVTGVFPLMQPLAAQEVLTSPGPLEQAAKPITPENPIPRRIFAPPAYYPAAGLASEARAAVRLRVTVNDRGAVAEIRRLNVTVYAPTVTGDALTTLQSAFAAAAAEAARRWVYEPPADAPIAFDIGFDFAPTAAEATHDQGRAGERLSTGITVGPPARVSPAWAGEAVRVGGAVGQPAKTKHVNPVYPPLAQQTRVSGLVILEAIIGEDGRVQDARVIRPAPLQVLDEAALEAVRQWEFTPTLLNGRPTAVVMTVTVNFTLN